MEFYDSIKQFSNRVASLKDTITTEDKKRQFQSICYL